MFLEILANKNETILKKETGTMLHQLHSTATQQMPLSEQDEAILQTNLSALQANKRAEKILSNAPVGKLLHSRAKEMLRQTACDRIACRDLSKLKEEAERLSGVQPQSVRGCVMNSIKGITRQYVSLEVKRRNLLSNSSPSFKQESTED